MREGNYEGGGRKSWDKFCGSHVIAEYGDPMVTIRSLDRYLEKQGKEVVLVDTGSSDVFFRIEDREAGA